MAIPVKVDEDLSEDVAELLRSTGAAARSVREQHWSGRRDPELWQSVQAEGMIFVTADKGFGQLASGAKHHGLILLRPERESRQEFLRLMQKVLDRGILEKAQGAIVIATSDRIRIRTRRDE